MSMPPSSRRMALEILRRTLDLNQDLQAAVDTVLAAAPSGPDRGLATELSYGYLRLRGRIDFLLGQLFKNPAQTSPILKRILGVAAYELLFLSRIPEYATLDWAVSLVRERLNQTMGKVANGVLRNLIRLGQAVHLPEYYAAKTAGQAQFLAGWHSCPPWLAQLWLDAYGMERAGSYLQATVQPPPIGVRINRMHTRREELRRALEPHALCRSEWGFALNGWPDFLHEAVDAGVVTRQSLAAQKIMDELGAAQWPQPIFDACAGRGGKTYLMAELGAETWAADVNVFRLHQLHAEGRRLGQDVPAFRAPGQGPHPLRRLPGTVFLDAPCSGLGVISRRPDIKWKRTPGDCAGLVELQKEILHGAAGLLTTGGYLVYVTCTLNPEENQKQVEAFMRAHSDFKLRQQTQSEQTDGLGEFFYGAVLSKS